MRTPEQAIRNFVYFTLNFPLDFVEQVWKSEPNLAKHLREKLHGYSGEKGYTSGGDMITFFVNLSSDRQKQLAEWADENYNEVKADD